jgi:hypothetical protein
VDVAGLRKRDESDKVIVAHAGLSHFKLNLCCHACRDEPSVSCRGCAVADIASLWYPRRTCCKSGVY